MGCDEENYQKDLHDLFLVWNQASTTPLFIGKRGHERTQHPTGRSNVALQKASPGRAPLFNARKSGPAHRVTTAPLEELPPYDPPMQRDPQQGRSRSARDAVMGRICRPRDSAVPAPQPATKTGTPSSRQHWHPPKAGGANRRMGRPHHGSSNRVQWLHDYKNRKSTRGPLTGV